MHDGTRRDKPRLRMALFGSLALNLLFLTGLGGALYMGHSGSGQPDRMGGPISRALAEEDRAAIQQEMRKLRRDEAGARGAYAAVIAGIAAELRAPDFDRADMEQQMSAQRAFFAERMALGQSLLMDRLEQMTAEQRAALADRLEEGLRRKRH